MLPPVDSTVLQNNPDFAILYKTLTTVILNPNGSTKADPKAKQREAVKQELQSHRLTTLKQTLLLSALSVTNPTSTPAKPTIRRPARTAPAPSSSGPEPQPPADLPPDLIQLLILLPPLLSPSTTLSPTSTTLLLSNPPFTTLPSHLPSLSSALSSTLLSRATLLSRLLNQSTNPSFLHRTIPSLPTQTTTLIDSLASRKHDLTTARTAVTEQLVQYIHLRTEVLAVLIRCLESKHGNIARSLELRAAEVAVVARRQEGEVDRMLGVVRGEVYTPEARRALEEYGRHLRDLRGRVREESGGLEAVLREYGVAVGREDRDGGEKKVVEMKRKGDENKERILREMARVYAKMRREGAEVEEEIERLGRA